MSEFQLKILENKYTIYIYIQQILKLSNIDFKVTMYLYVQEDRWQGGGFCQITGAY